MITDENMSYTKLSTPMVELNEYRIVPNKVLNL